MSNLNAFLHPVQGDETREIIVSNRFLDENGRPVPFRIRALTQEENDAISKRSMRLVKGGRRGEKELDSTEYASRIIAAATLEPDFSSEELCKAYGTMDPLEVPGKMLYAGEYKRLMDAIMELSRFGGAPSRWTTCRTGKRS